VWGGEGYLLSHWRRRWSKISPKSVPYFYYLATFVALTTDDELVDDVTEGIVEDVAPLPPIDDDVDDEGVG